MASGSETRHRTNHLKLRLTDDERSTLDAAAERAGLSLSGWARSTLLNAPPVRQARRPPIERAELHLLLSQLGKLGSNVNQIARVLNGGGEAEPPALAGSRADIAMMRAAIMMALGRKPADDPASPDEPADPEPADPAL
jgi:hypothetical protein